MSRQLLDDIVSSCHYLESDKATDRKKNADNLKNLLQNPKVKDVLDERSIGGKSKEGTYTSIFKAVQGYLLKESELARSKWDTLNATTQLNRKVKLNEICSLLRSVSHIAVKNGPMLKCSEVVDSIVLIIKRNFQGKLFAGSYLDMFTADILTQRKYKNQISQKQYEDIIAYCCSCYTSPSEDVGPVRISSVLRHIMNAVISRFEATTFAYLFDFFSEAIPIMRKSQSALFIEQTLHILTEFVKWQACANDTMVVLFGQEVLPSVIGLMSSKKCTKDSFQILVELCHFMLFLFDDCSGCGNVFHQNFTERSIWFDILRSILCSVEQHIVNFSLSVKFSKARQIVCDVSICKLAAYTLFILFHQYSNYEVPVEEVLPFTQVPSQINQLNFKEKSQVLRYLPIQNMEETVTISYWLQIVFTLLKYENCNLNASDTVKFLECFQLVLMETKCIDVLCKVFNCMSTLAAKIDKTNISANADAIWIKALDAAKQQITLSKSTALSEACCQFISTLFSNNYLLQYVGMPSPYSNILNTLWPSITRTTSLQSFSTLLKTLINLQPILESNVVSFARNLKDDNPLTNKRPLRCGIITFLLGCSEVEMARNLVNNSNDNFINQTQGTLNLSHIESGVHGHAIETNAINIPNLFCNNGSVSFKKLPDVQVLVDVLVMLCCKNPWYYQTEDIQSITDDCSVWLSPDFLKQRKKLLFDLRISSPKASDDEVVPIVEVCQFLMEKIGLLVTHMQHLLDNQSDFIYLLLEQTAFLISVLLTLAVCWPFSEIVSLVNNVDAMLVYFCRHISIVIKSPQTVGILITTCKNMTRAVTLLNICKDGMKKSKIIEGLQLGLQTCCTEIAKISKDALTFLSQPDMQQVAPFMTSASSSGYYADSLSDRSSDHLKKSQTYRRKRYGEMPSDSPALKRPHIGSNSNTNQNMFTSQFVSTKCAFECFKKTFEFLCVTNSVMDIQSSSDVLGCTLAEDLVLSKPLTAETVIHTIQISSLHKHRINSDQMSTIVNTLQTLFTLHYQDEEICGKCLNALSHLIPLLFESAAYSQESKDDILSVLDIIKKLVFENKTGPFVTIAFMKCLTCLSKCLPNQSESNDTLSSKFSVLAVLARFISFSNSSVSNYSCHSMLFVTSSFHCFNNVSNCNALCLHALACIKNGIRQMVSQILADVSGNKKNAETLLLGSTFSIMSALCGLLNHEGHFLEKEVAQEICIFAYKLKKSTSNPCFRKAIWNITHFCLDKLQNYLNIPTDLKKPALLTRHLLYIMSKWSLSTTKKKYLEFPNSLWGVSRPLFYMQHITSTFPISLLLRSEIIEDSKGFLKTDCVLRNDVLSTTTANILALLCHNSGKNLEHINAKDLLQKLATEFRYDSSYEMIKSYLPRIIVHLLSMFHSTTNEPQTNDNIVSNMSMLDPTPSAFITLDEASFEATISIMIEIILKKSAEVEKSYLKVKSLVNLLSTSPAEIHLFMSLLYEMITKSLNSVELRQRFIAYRFFILLIFSYYTNDNLKEMITRCVVFVVTNLIGNVCIEMPYAETWHTMRNYSLTCSIGLDLLFWIFSTLLSDDISQSWCVLNHSTIVSAVIQCLANSFKLSTFLTIKYPTLQSVDAVFQYHKNKLTSLLKQNKLISKVYKSSFKNVSLCPDNPISLSVTFSQDMLDTPVLCERSLSVFINEANISKELSKINNEMLNPANIQCGNLLTVGKLLNLAGIFYKAQALNVLHQPTVSINIKKAVVWLAQQNQNKMLQESVGKCFGSMGLLSFDENIVLYNVLETKVSYLDAIWQLWQDCVDTNPQVQIAASGCLSKIFQGETLYQVLDEIKGQDDIVAKYLCLLSSNKTCQSSFATGDITTMISMWSCRTKFYNTWLCELTQELIKCCKEGYIHSMEDISKISPCFCEKLFPELFVLISISSKESAATMAQHLDVLFKSAFSEDTTPLNTKCLLLGLKVVQYIRGIFKEESYDKTPSIKGKHINKQTLFNRMNIDLLLAAKVALICKQPFVAVLFVEIWTDQVEDKLETEQLAKDRSRTGATRALSFSSDYSDLDQATKLKQQTLRWRCQGMKSPMSVLQTSPQGDEAKCTLIAAYDLIGELDGLHGCYRSYPLKAVHDKTLVHVREKEGRWTEALKLHDFALSRDNTMSSQASNIIESLQQSGFEHLCNVYMKSLETAMSESESCNMDQNLLDLQYKALWYTGQWDESLVSIQNHHVKAETGFQQHLYRCFASLFDDEGKNFAPLLKQARIDCVRDLSQYQSNNVIVHDLHQASSRLQCLKEVEDVYKVKSEKLSASDMFNSWVKYDKPNSTLDFQFDDIYLVLSARSSIFKSLAEWPALVDTNFEERWRSHLLSAVLVCCDHGRLQSAHKALYQLGAVVTQLGSSNMSGLVWKHRVKLEEAKLLWRQTEESFALGSLQNLQGEIEVAMSSYPSSDTSSLQLLLAETLRTQGAWLQASRFEGPTVIMDDYLEKSATMVERVYNSCGNTTADERLRNNALDQLVENYYMLAKFSDQQYQQVIKYKKSSEYAQKKHLASASKEDLVSMQESGQVPGRKTVLFVDKNVTIDKRELARIDEKGNDFLSSALRSYIRCLQMSDERDMVMHRLCALWLENANLSAVASLLAEQHNNIASYKYIPLAYQLAARMHGANASAGFQSTLREVLLRVTVDHPYHVLPVILALANANKDDELTSLSNPSHKRKQSRKSTPSKQNVSSRVEAARSLVERVRRKKASLVSHTELVMNAYIEFANFDASPWKNQPSKQIDIPKQLAIAKFTSQSQTCANIQDVAIPVSATPLSKTAKYESLSGLIKYRYLKPHFQTCGGVNLPKALIAVGSDGQSKKHLVKGKDDLRQDAVMQQVFETVNSLLSKDHSTSGLRVRTYKVVPLSQRSGLVEWCVGTVPIGVYLAGNPAQGDGGAHHRYRPSDIAVLKCRKAMMEVANKPAASKLQKYRDICSSFKPVFRHFFTECYVDPAQWFAKRRSYTRSVAASSIVGYVLGLGDRHVQNILVDFTTAELVHIDLGVAFEQGRCLPTPETVPFRLTRDIVDGMGVTGVEGAFRRCCERTMQAMRTSNDIITTIVEVLLYDPLHDWTLSPSKARLIQRQTAENTEAALNASVLSTSSVAFKCGMETHCFDRLNTNKLAERVLLRLQEKLRGQEEGSLLSVGGQVNMLIQQASDPARLCMLFAGWQPYL